MVRRTCHWPAPTPTREPRCSGTPLRPSCRAHATPSPPPRTRLPSPVDRWGSGVLHHTTRSPPHHVVLRLCSPTTNPKGRKGVEDPFLNPLWRLDPGQNRGVGYPPRRGERPGGLQKVGWLDPSTNPSKKDGRMEGWKRKERPSGKKRGAEGRKDRGWRTGSPLPLRVGTRDGSPSSCTTEQMHPAFGFLSPRVRGCICFTVQLLWGPPILPFPKISMRFGSFLCSFFVFLHRFLRASLSPSPPGRWDPGFRSPWWLSTQKRPLGRDPDTSPSKLVGSGRRVVSRTSTQVVWGVGAKGRDSVTFLLAILAQLGSWSSKLQVRVLHKKQRNCHLGSPWT